MSNTRTAEYRAFDANTLIGYLAGIEVVAELLGESQWTANEVGDGNVNQVFIVEPAPGSEGTPVVVKQALPYLRVAGDDWPLTRERMRHEIAALERYGDLVPGRAPAVIHTAPEMSLVVMEYLAAHEVMRGPLMAGRTFPQFAAHVGTFVAETCFATSDLALSGPAKKALVVERSNPELCELQEDFVFTNPFMESEENEWNPALDELVAQGVLTGLVATIAYGLAINRLGVPRAASFSVLVPVIATVLAFFWIGEVPSVLDGVALAVGTLGVAVVNGVLRRPRRPGPTAGTPPIS